MITDLKRLFKDKKGQATPLAYISTVSASILFSLLMIGISTRFNDINTLAAWANARSFAQSVSTRAYTSADCFAYESAGAVYSEKSKEFETQRRVYPGVIDIRKFTKDQYFDCIQHYYFSRAASSPLLEGKSIKDMSAAFVEFKLRDLENPYQVAEYGKRTLSTEKQLDRQEVVDMTIQTLRKLVNGFATIGEWIFMGISLTIDIVIPLVTSTATGGAGGMDVDMDLIMIPGYVHKKGSIEVPGYMENLMLGEELITLLKSRESIYSYSTPVVIRYIDEEGHFVEEHLGVLETKIHYSLYGRR